MGAARGLGWILGMRGPLVATMSLVIFTAGCMKTATVVDHSVVLALADDEHPPSTKIA